MKIIDGKPVPWVGKEISCYVCGSRIQLEKPHDAMCQTAEGATYGHLTLACPVCHSIITIPPNQLRTPPATTPPPPTQS